MCSLSENFDHRRLFFGFFRCENQHRAASKKYGRCGAVEYHTPAKQLEIRSGRNDTAVTSGAFQRLGAVGAQEHMSLVASVKRHFSGRGALCQIPAHVTSQKEIGKACFAAWDKSKQKKY